MCKCDNYEKFIAIDNHMVVAYKCQDCGREWFQVYNIQLEGEYEGNFEDEGWGI